MNYGNQPTPMPSSPLSGKVQEDSALDICLNQMDEQLSMFYNRMNTLEQLAERLKANDAPTNGNPVPQPAKPSDHCGIFAYHLDTFNHLNIRLEAIVSYLQRAI
jgi:hypothetical protein